MIDVQLLELATRPYPGKYLQGLSKCVEESTGLTLEERRQWQNVKEDGVNIFAIQVFTVTVICCVAWTRGRCEPAPQNWRSRYQLPG